MSPSLASLAAGPQNSEVVSLSMSASTDNTSQCHAQTMSGANGILNMQRCDDGGLSMQARTGSNHYVRRDSKPANNCVAQQDEGASIDDVGLTIESTPAIPVEPSRGVPRDRAKDMESSRNVVVFTVIPSESSTDDATETSIVVHATDTLAALDVRQKDGSGTGNGKVNEAREHHVTTQNKSQTNTSEKQNNTKTEIGSRHCKDKSDRGNATKITQPQPSTSATPAVGSMNRLTILPRTSQYEKHALMQTRQDSGMSELEEFLQEKEHELMMRDDNVTTASRHQQLRANTLDDRKMCADGGAASRRQQLQPRGAQCEKSPLLVKNESGLSELEIYLLEKDAEASKKSSLKTRSASCEAPRSASCEATVARQASSEATVARRQRLEPRSSQYEESSLLETRDETGLSAIEQFLNEQEDGDEECSGKCSPNHMCKSVSCGTCRPEPGTRQQTSSKRVHFKQCSSGSIEVQLDMKGAKAAGQKQQGNQSRTNRWRHSLRLPRQHSKSGDAMTASKTENNKCRTQTQKSCTIS